jgi:hypothetical protein
MGRLSQQLKASHGVDSLRDAAAVCLVFYLLAAALMLLSIRPLRAAWVADQNA